jgi:hypothetical protein
MKRLLLIALMAGGLAFVPAQRSDAQVSVGIGFGYPSYGYRYYPYGYGPVRILQTVSILWLFHGPLVLPVRAPGLPPPPASSLLSLLS